MSKVLVIDDDPMILRMAGFILKKGGHTAVSAQSGQQGLDIVSGDDIDFVFIDCEMPGMSGFETLEKLKAQCGTPVCLMTGTLTESTREKALALGALDCIGKPINAQQMLSVIK